MYSSLYGTKTIINHINCLTYYRVSCSKTIVQLCIYIWLVNHFVVFCFNYFHLDKLHIIIVVLMKLALVHILTKIAGFDHFSLISKIEYSPAMSSACEDSSCRVCHVVRPPARLSSVKGQCFSTESTDKLGQVSRQRAAPMQDNRLFRFFCRQATDSCTGWIWFALQFDVLFCKFPPWLLALVVALLKMLLSFLLSLFEKFMHSCILLNSKGSTPRSVQATS